MTKPAGEGFLFSSENRIHKMEDAPFYVESERLDSEAEVSWLNFHFLQPPGLTGERMHSGAAGGSGVG